MVRGANQVIEVKKELATAIEDRKAVQTESEELQASVARLKGDRAQEIESRDEDLQVRAWSETD